MERRKYVLWMDAYVQSSISQTDFPTEVSDETIEFSDTTLTLQEVAIYLDEYRRSSLVLAQNLKELRMKAERAGDTELAETVSELEQSAMGIVKKLKQE